MARATRALAGRYTGEQASKQASRAAREGLYWFSNSECKASFSWLLLNHSPARNYVTIPFCPSYQGNFIMQVVDIRAFSVMFAVLFIPDSWSRIYRGILSLLREIL